MPHMYHAPRQIPAGKALCEARAAASSFLIARFLSVSYSELEKMRGSLHFFVNGESGYQNAAQTGAVSHSTDS